MTTTETPAETTPPEVAPDSPELAEYKRKVRTRAIRGHQTGDLSERSLRATLKNLELEPYVPVRKYASTNTVHVKVFTDKTVDREAIEEGQDIWNNPKLMAAIEQAIRDNLPAGCTLFEGDISQGGAYTDNYLLPE